MLEENLEKSELEDEIPLQDADQVDDFDEYKPESYVPVSQKSALIDPVTQEVVDHRQLRPIDIILESAKAAGVRTRKVRFFKDGKYDTGCKRTGCWGRGYVGFLSDGLPNPCSCLFYSTDRPNLFEPTHNREFARKLSKMKRSETFKDKAAKAAELGLKQVDVDTWVDSEKRTFHWRSGKDGFKFEIEKEPHA